MELNPQQRRAVEHTQGPLLILAGAGSGKTRVITSRIVHLISQRKVSPWNILAVTFTNKAAGEMRHRVEAELGPRSQPIWMATFHASCLRILRRHIDKLGYNPEFVIYDPTDQKRLMKQCLEIKRITERVMKPQAALARIDAAKNSLTSPQKYRLQASDTWGEMIAELYELYQKKLKSNNALDFGDLLMKTVELFEDHPDVLSSYQRSFQYIMVDEYQDTNQAQYRLVTQLADQHKNICVVGDEDQSIYAWRGADISNILNFEKDFPGTVLIKLEQNYRSTQKILTAATKVIEHNQHRKGKVLWTGLGEGETPQAYESKDERGEARFVVQKIRELKVLESRRWSDFAIFYRVNAQSRSFEDELGRQRIPYTIYGGVKFYERKEIKDILSYLKVIVNPADPINLKRIINTPTRGIGEKSLLSLESFASDHNLYLYEALAKIENITTLNQGAQKRLIHFFRLIEGLKGPLKEIPVTDFVKKVMEESGYIDHLKRENTLEAEGRLENLEELLNVIHDYESREEEPTLRGFLDQASLFENSDKLEETEGVLPLMTLHLAKGLEFPVVFIVGMEEGLFPHSRSLDDEGEMEEERRLCYVGMTRARERLHFTHAGKRRLYGGNQYNLPSRFLEEIPKDHLEYLGRQQTVKKTVTESWDPPFEMDFDQSPLGERSLFCVGSKVRHPTFGFGVVKRCQGKDESQKVTVYFQDGRVKTLMLQYARLEPA